MKHADCGGTLKRWRSGKYRCAECAAVIDVGVNPSAHMTDDRDHLRGEIPNSRRMSARSGDYNVPTYRRQT
jgi:hypothetical protein